MEVGHTVDVESEMMGMIQRIKAIVVGDRPMDFGNVLHGLVR